MVGILTICDQRLARVIQHGPIIIDDELGARLVDEPGEGLASA